jgi:lipopolysaccharide transport system ATP-binding protein
MSDQDVVIRVEGVSKLYRLGEVGTGSLAHDVNRWWHKVRGKEDPYLKIGEVNDRTKSVSSVQRPESSAKNANALAPQPSSLDSTPSSSSRPLDPGLSTPSSSSALDSRPSTLVSAPQAQSDWVYALKDVSFEVKRGEVLGIIGRNGAGKSTLLKILSRVTTQSSGSIKVKGRIASLLEVGTGFHPELTGRENIFLNGAILGMRKAEIARKFDEIVEFSGCARYIDTPVKRYSSGMYVRLAFAVAANLEPEILIVDEVLAVGDLEFQKKCLGKMQDVAKNGRTILFVSHNIDAVKRLCSRGILLANGIIEYVGDIVDVTNRYIGNQLNIKSRKNTLHNNADLEFGCALEVSIEDKNEIQTCEFVEGNPWKIKVKFLINKHLKHFIIGFGLKTQSNHACRVSWSNPQPVEPGNYECVFNESDIFLSSGIYEVTIGLSESEYPFHYIDNAAVIRINKNPINYSKYNLEGTTITPCEATIKKCNQ